MGEDEERSGAGEGRVTFLYSPINRQCHKAHHDRCQTYRKHILRGGLLGCLCRFDRGELDMSINFSHERETGSGAIGSAHKKAREMIAGFVV